MNHCFISYVVLLEITMKTLENNDLAVRTRRGLASGNWRRNVRG